ncbi:CMP deaminase family/ methyltransferase bifunctional enzyme involved in riboflavin biosynthesis and tRNA pseudouridine biosynthesis Rib2 [Schizosaccharomyces osmophilus]|uniref:CMP deaminase family/ methyltransferase bifunctional enzyme involved in riboflavin biosynthesis and tRNA pseudouridine biosynthesis Rib2 n=1 Tax=Schizosaccharomyces osmophilus TaxID=2545709 RepID=A0AAE9WGB2_9SCHI|nr:CMP deaminase family/ methyltransferase bifunctional enzyme involved in riboflavin biosynthesis and tRNA pseudouridine biosynthesis Rib2 [Schizosaccharomyces osmophilus]WBW75238.1 CMP deaminase family/ methyltransferase bifunctional enzyme involved in riboflavin biosynthesis and tRNA pseudouridine biosynthesis Rib2 [Schizosaccharomyces osmophilus]
MEVPSNLYAPIEEVEEDVQVLFAVHKKKNADLGMFDSRLDRVNLELDEHKIQIKQNRQSLHQLPGSTGSVVWKTSISVIPWLMKQSWFANTLSSDVSVIELGSGISGIGGILLGPRVGKYIATDQIDYLKELRENLDQNGANMVEVSDLDWTNPPSEKEWKDASLDILCLFDCIYNPNLNTHLVSTMASFAQLFPDLTCLVGQELRDPETLTDFLLKIQPYYQVFLFNYEQEGFPENMALFLLKPYNHKALMYAALKEARKCEPTDSAFCIGSVLVLHGEIVSTGHSRELPGNTHAEECAIMKYLSQQPHGSSLKGTMIYSTMEPCSKRLSGKKSCTDLIISQNISTVVLGSREPDTFVKCEGVDLLKNSGVNIIEELSFQDECLKEAVRGHHGK